MGHPSMSYVHHRLDVSRSSCQKGRTSDRTSRWHHYPRDRECLTSDSAAAWRSGRLAKQPRSNRPASRMVGIGVGRVPADAPTATSIERRPHGPRSGAKLLDRDAAHARAAFSFPRAGSRRPWTSRPGAGKTPPQPRARGGAPGSRLRRRPDPLLGFSFCSRRRGAGSRGVPGAPSAERGRPAAISGASPRV